MNNFISYLFLNYVIILLVVSVANWVTGIAKGLLVGEFNFGKALNGLKELVLLGIGYLAFAAFAFVLQDVKMLEVQFFSALLGFITVLIIAYKGNSLLINFVALAKIPTPKVLATVDAKVKALFEQSTPTSVFGVSEEDVVKSDIIG